MRQKEESNAPVNGEAGTIMGEGNARRRRDDHETRSSLTCLSNVAAYTLKAQRVQDTKAPLYATKMSERSPK